MYVRMFSYFVRVLSIILSFIKLYILGVVVYIYLFFFFFAQNRKTAKALTVTYGARRAKTARPTKIEISFHRINVINRYRFQNHNGCEKKKLTKRPQIVRFGVVIIIIIL